MDNHTLLKCENLTVERGDFLLCQVVHLSLSKGDICHLTGENGTGKTTFLMQLVGLLPILTGKVIWQNVEQLPVQPLYISHQLGINLQLTVKQNLQFLLGLYNIKLSDDELNQALTWVGLSGYEDVHCYQLSAGQTRRVGLARLWFGLQWVKTYPLWLLDEPLTALDVQMIAKMEQMMQDFASQGGAVLLTSHQNVAVANKFLDLTDYMM